MEQRDSNQRGVVELVVIGLLAALVVLLAVPLLFPFERAPEDPARAEHHGLTLGESMGQTPDPQSTKR